MTLNKMLIISDYIQTDIKIKDIDIVGWDKLPLRSVLDYRFIVLDMGGKTYDLVKTHSSNISRDMKVLFDTDNIVICLTDRFLESYQYANLSKTLHKHQIKSNPRFYSWMRNWGYGIHIQTVNLGKRINIRTKNIAIKSYLENSYYSQLIFGYIGLVKENSHTYSAIIIGDSTCKIDILGTPARTNDIIACTIDINKGKLVFLPQPVEKGDATVNSLYKIAMSLVEEEISIPPPNWLEKHKLPKHIEKEKELKTFLKEKEKEGNLLKKEIGKYARVNTLLYGYDTPLQKAVKTVFEDFGLEMKKTATGATVDYIGHDIKNKRKFIFEVTGIKGKLKKNSRKFGQIFDYFKSKENEDEKILLVINTFREIDPVKRKDKEHITKDAMELLKSMDVCILLTTTLFDIWKGFKEKNTEISTILDELHNTTGIYEYPKK